jgi:hypothetical protein
VTKRSDGEFALGAKTIDRLQEPLDAIGFFGRGHDEKCAALGEQCDRG